VLRGGPDTVASGERYPVRTTSSPSMVSTPVFLVAEARGQLHFSHGGSGVVELGRVLASRRMCPNDS
jgi:hypothetical protein